MSNEEIKYENEDLINDSVKKSLENKDTESPEGFMRSQIFEFGKLASVARTGNGEDLTPEEKELRNKITDFCMKMVALLPQAPFVDMRQAQVWLESAFKKNPYKTLWHAARLKGFGGSDMGVLYAATYGDQGASPFTTNVKIIQDKKVASKTEEDNIHTSRGTIMEPYVQDIFLNLLKNGMIFDALLSKEEKDHLMANPKKNPLFGAKSILTAEMEEAFSNFYDEEHPWLVGNPDEILLTPDGKIIIVDYKAPANPHEIIPDYYRAQVHHYALIFKKNFPELADKVETIGLASFNYYEGASIIYREEPYDEIIAQRVLEVGDHYWNEYVLTDKYPSQIGFGAYSEVDNIQPQLVSYDENGNIKEVKSVDFESGIEEGLVKKETVEAVLDGGTELHVGDAIETITKLLSSYSVSRLTAIEAQAVSEEQADTLKYLLANKMAPMKGVDTITTPVANITYIKKYKTNELMPDLIKFWEDIGLNEDTINKEIYQNPRAYLTAEFDPELFFNAVKVFMNDLSYIQQYEKGDIDETEESQLKYESLKERITEELTPKRAGSDINLKDIPLFWSAIDSSKKELDINYLIRFTEKYSKDFPFEKYIDLRASDLTVRLRQPKLANDVAVVQEMKEGLRGSVKQLILEDNSKYMNDRREAIKSDYKEEEEALKAEQEAKEAENERKRLEKEAAALKLAQEKEQAKLEKEAKKLADKKVKEEDKVISKVDTSTAQDTANDILANLTGATKSKSRVKK